MTTGLITYSTGIDPGAREIDLVRALDCQDADLSLTFDVSDLVDPVFDRMAIHALGKR